MCKTDFYRNRQSWYATTCGFGQGGYTWGGGGAIGRLKLRLQDLKKKGGLRALVIAR